MCPAIEKFKCKNDQLMITEKRAITIPPDTTVSKWDFLLMLWFRIWLTFLVELEFDHKFKSREAVYYGNFQYQYGGATHNPKPVPKDAYLGKICSYMSVVLPDFSYNSALINYYATG